MEVTRRGLITGSVCLVAAPAIVKIENIMRIHDPLVRGIRFQSWPWDEERPPYWTAGSIQQEKTADLTFNNYGWIADYMPINKVRLSTLLDSVNKHKLIYPDIVWKEIW